MEYNKRIATIGQYFRYYFTAALSFSKFVTRKKFGITQDFMERIMLAVTEVNGCRICSQAHAKIALESGMSSEEIDSLLSNDQQTVPQDQQIAILFATHYADTCEKPDPETVERLEKEYGKNTAKAVIAVCNMIMVGNTLGIAANTIRHGMFVHDMILFAGTVVLFPAFILTAVVGLFR